MQSRGDAQVKNVAHLLRVKLHLVEMEIQHTSAQSDDTKTTRHTIGEDGGAARAVHIHTKNLDKQEIQKHFDAAGQEQEVHGALGVADGPQNSGGEVIQHQKWNAQEIQPEIQGSIVKKRGGTLGQLQQRFCKQDADRGKNDTAGNGQNHGCAHGFFCAEAVLLAHVFGNYNVCAGGDADEQTGAQVDQHGTSAHSTHGGVAHKVAQHHHIHDAENVLHRIRDDNGHHQRQQTLGDGAGKHVDIFRFQSTISLRRNSNPL